VRRLVALLSLCIPCFAHGTTYQFVGATYVSAGGLYTLNMRVTGYFTTAAPLPANRAFSSLGPLLQSWSFDDGVNTLTSVNANAAKFDIATDANGNITSFVVNLMSPPPPNAIGQLVNLINITPAAPAGFVASGATCASLDAMQRGDFTSNVDIFAWETTLGVWTAVNDQNVVPVPASASAGLIGLVTLVLASGALTLRRRRQLGTPPSRHNAV
jgi:hypothetical protein